MKATEINTGDGTPVHDAFVCGSGADPGDNVSDGCCDVLIIDEPVATQVTFCAKHSHRFGLAFFMHLLTNTLFSFMLPYSGCSNSLDKKNALLMINQLELLVTPCLSG